MSIGYKMIQRADYINPEGEKKEGYYPQVVRNRTINIRELSDLASRGSTFNNFEIEIAIRMVLKQIEKELLDSNHVCLDEFGTFSLTAESRHVENPDDLRAESIKVKRVVFITSKILKNRMKNARFKKTV